MTAAQLVMALTEAGATEDQRTWQPPGGATAPPRDRALVSIAAGRVLARQEMIDALVAAGYAATSARARKISSHPLIRRMGPDRYLVIGGESPVLSLPLPAAVGRDAIAGGPGVGVATLG